MKRALLSYIDPYDHRRSDAIDRYEWGMSSDKQLDEELLMVDLIQKYGIYPYSDRELQHFAERGDMVQPLRNMCTIVQKGAVAQNMYQCNALLETRNTPVSYFTESVHEVLREQFKIVSNRSSAYIEDQIEQIRSIKWDNDEWD